MLFQKTTFERLFPAALSGNGLQIQTNFGFESAGKRYFDVSVPGRPRIEQGMTVIALLEKPNEWDSRSLLGWIDCVDGALVCDSPGKLFGFSLVSVFFASIFPLRAHSVFHHSENADLIAVFVAALFAAFAVHFLFLYFKALLVRRALISIREFINLGNLIGK